MAAPPGRVWAALVDPEALLAWLPPGGMTARFERFDARPGGSYRMVLTYSDASGAPGKATADSDVVEARFVDIVPGERVVQAVDFVSDDPAYAGTMTMTWEVAAVEAGTRVDIVAEDVPDGISAEDHAAGLSSSLANLADYVEVRGMTEVDLSRAEWRKSSYSGQSGNCVEVARNLPGLVAVRDSKAPDGAKLMVSHQAWRAFLEAHASGA